MAGMNKKKVITTTLYLTSRKVSYIRRNYKFTDFSNIYEYGCSEKYQVGSSPKVVLDFF